jgi:hypothetical protein
VTDPPIACTLTPGELRAGAADLLPGLAASADRRSMLPRGIRLEFAPRAATLRRIGEVIARERRCCRFLSFRLDTRTATGEIALDITGPEGTPDFLVALLGESTSGGETRTGGGRSGRETGRPRGLAVARRHSPAGDDSRT